MSKSTYGGHRLELSNLDKTFFPDSKLTKGDLIDYYQRISDYILPYLKDRPLTLHRFPDGIDGDGFFQQSRSDHYPDWMPALEIKHGGDTGTKEHILCPDKGGLAYLADQGAITLHAWLSQKDNLEYPDQLIVDLDPSGEDFEPVRKAAKLVGEGMRELGLRPFLKSTGSRGLHVVAPLKPKQDFDRVRELAGRFTERLAAAHDKELTTEQRKNKRRGRIYLDIMRNAFGQTAVAPYAVRALPGAPVAAPLAWDELEDGDLGPQSFNIENLFRRLGQKQDPWSGMGRHGVDMESIAQAMEDDDDRGCALG